MCLVVDYSEKLVKSDYFGVIIYNWWRKVRKIGIFSIKNAYFTESSYEHPKYSGFSIQKNIQWSVFQAEYTEKSGHSMVFFRKIGKITIFHTKLTTSISLVGRKIRKIGFYDKTGTIFKSFPLQEITKITIIVKYTENSQNLRLCTIENNSNQSSEKFSPIVSKIWHFLKCHNNCYLTSVNCSHTKISKQQLIAHTSIVKRITVSVTNTHNSSSNALLCQLVSQAHKLLKQ